MGPPAETHNRLRGGRRVDCIPFVCKSHNGNEAKYMSFLSGTLVPYQCQSEASISCKRSIIKCSITVAPKGLPAHTPLQQTGNEHIYLPNCWCCIEHHIRGITPCLPCHVGTEKMPPWLILIVWQKSDSHMINFYGLDCPEDQQSKGHKNCWCCVLEMTEVDIRMRIKII